MPPKLALLICTIFVLFLLRMERKQSPGVSRVAWIPTIWMLYIASKPLGVWFQYEGPDMESGSPLDRVFLTGLLLLGMLILLARGFRWSETIRGNKWVVLIIAYMLISILWSAMPYVSFKRWTRELVAVAMAFLVVTEQHPSEALCSVFRRTIYAAIPFSYILIHYFPEYGRQYGHWSGALMWVGVAQQKNGLGRLCVFSAFFLVWSLLIGQKSEPRSFTKYKKSIQGFVLFLALWLLGGPQHTLTYSATSTLTLAAGLLLFLWLSYKREKKSLAGQTRFVSMFVAFLLVYGVATPFVGGLSLIDISSVLSREQTLTGRADIWAILVPLAMARPTLGHGIGGFWTDEMRNLTSSHAHNGYLDVILDLGLVGLGLNVMFVLWSMRNAQRVMHVDFGWGSLWLCCVLMILVHNITESSIGTFTSHFNAVILFLAVSSSTSLWPEGTRKSGFKLLALEFQRGRSP